MSGSLTRHVLLALTLLTGLGSPTLAQTSDGRDASFLPAGSSGTATPSSDFSGLATEAPTTTVTGTITISPSVPAPAPGSLPPGAAPSPKQPAAQTASAPTIQPVVTTTLPNVSAESIGVQEAGGLGADMWKGTPRPVAEALVTLATPTSSPLLNTLTRRLLATSAIAPESGDSAQSPTSQSLTSLRVEKLTTFGASTQAWALAKSADTKLISDATFARMAEDALIDEGTDPCGQAAELAKSRSGGDWQKILIVCALRAQDTKTAQVALDVLRSQPNRDNVFLEIADKNVIGSAKVLPFRLTPMTPASLALLRLSPLPLPLPGELYTHTDPAMVPALLHLTPQQDVAQIALAERSAERGLITPGELGAVYRSIAFGADTMAAPLNSIESGLRLRALMFKAAESEKDPGRRIAYAVKFVQSATPAFLNGAGAIAAGMLGKIQAEPAQNTNATDIAHIYMMAGSSEEALDWFKLAQNTPASADQVQALWPQFILNGLGAPADATKWFENALKLADQSTDRHSAREQVAATALLMDAAGIKIPDVSWARLLEPGHSEKRFIFSALLLDRLQSAGAAAKPAESVLLSVVAAGEGEISLPVAIGITRALRQAGLKSEAATFASHSIALLSASH